jgi:hypothetical protein
MAQPPAPQAFGDRFAPAPPGFSLTQDNSQWPWGQPAKFADPDEALEETLKRTMKPRSKKELFKLLMVGVSIEVIVEGIIFQGFQEGLFTPDVGMLMKPSLALVIADEAEEEGIPYRMFENDDAETEGEMDDETFLRMMHQNNPRMFNAIREHANAAFRAGSAPREPEPERGFLSAKEGDK